MLEDKGDYKGAVVNYREAVREVEGRADDFHMGDDDHEEECIQACYGGMAR